MNTSRYGVLDHIRRFHPRTLFPLLLALSLLASPFAAGAASAAPQPAGETVLSAPSTWDPSAFQTQAGRPGDAGMMKRLAETAREGDVIFQTTVSRQSLAIKIATQSDYTHCGVILRKDGKLQVVEAAKTVSRTPLETWVKRGVDQHYLLMRLKDPATLTPAFVKALHDAVPAFAGKAYDLLFQWSDDKMYCSELVWKLYHKAGIDLCALHTFRDYDLNHDAVQKIIKERYGMDMPWDEQVVAPSDLVHCELLKVVEKN